jgi:hypothetical protein
MGCGNMLVRRVLQAGRRRAVAMRPEFDPTMRLGRDASDDAAGEATPPRRLTSPRCRWRRAVVGRDAGAGRHARSSVTFRMP